jgi:hypothetical protein
MTFVPLVRILATVAAGAAMWWLWRRVARDPSVAWIVGAGFVGRALIAVALFWISFLALPIAPQLQIGNGLWFFAQDAVRYYRLALEAAAAGPTGILWVDPALPSACYIQMLAASVLALGPTPAAALVLNLAAYLTTCVLLVVWARRAGVPQGTLRMALVALSFSPSIALWSLQPLKDVPFLLLVVAYAMTTWLWLDALASPAPDARRLPAPVAALAAMAYVLAGIRWYFAMMLVVMSTAALILTVWRHRNARRAGFVSGTIFVISAALLVPVPAAPYLPGWVAQLVRPQSLRDLAAAPQAGMDYLNAVRSGSEREEAATQIRLGPSWQRSSASSTDASAGDGEPQTGSERLAAGLLVMLVPRVLLTSAGLVTLEGGRGFWAFADLDTVCFDATLIAALALMWRRRRSPAHPMLWPLILMTLAVVILMCYQVANFGTLFRLRSMVAICAILLIVLPPAAAVRTGRVP